MNEKLEALNQEIEKTEKKLRWAQQEEKRLTHQAKALTRNTSLLLGPSYDLINIYSRESLFRQYLGFDIEFAGEEELEAISATPEFEQMAEYPYYGSVKMIGDYIVVKLG